MASLGHVAVGMLAGRFLVDRERSPPVVPMVVFSGLALLPDLDYVAVMLGWPDAGPCGHRGATHSMIPPLVVTLLVAAIAPRMRLPRWKTAALAGLTVASHVLLDAMTVSSRGMPLLWPISFARFEMPWRPIPNAPCGLDFLSLAGLRVASIELFQFLPLIVAALWPWPLSLLAPFTRVRIPPAAPGAARRLDMARELTRDAS
ncbi:MAG: metal-dependent hydrolase [Pseudomonadota bacterium]